MQDTNETQARSSEREGHITIGRTISNMQDDYITVRLTGQKANGKAGRVVTVEVSLEDFAVAVTGGMAPCRYRLYPEAPDAD